MLRILSTNAASYITTITGVKADIITKKGRNYFRFPMNADVMNAYNDYRNAQNERSELMIDLIKFNSNFKMYKEMSHNKTMESR